MIGSKQQWSGLIDRPVTGGVKFRRENDKTCSSGPAYPTNTLGLAAQLWVRAKIRNICKAAQNCVALSRHAANVLPYAWIQHGSSQAPCHECSQLRSRPMNNVLTHS